MRTFNIMVIDGADNCAYDIYAASEKLFRAIYALEGQNIEFIEDFRKRYPDGEYDSEFREMWSNPIKKALVRGIDGILFYELEAKKQFYPNKMDSDLDWNGRSWGH